MKSLPEVEFKVTIKSKPNSKPNKKGRFDDLITAVSNLTPNSEESVFIPYEGRLASVNSFRSHLTKVFKTAGFKVTHLNQDGGVYIWYGGKRNGVKQGFKWSTESRVKASLAHKKRWDKIKAITTTV